LRECNDLDPPFASRLPQRCFRPHGASGTTVLAATAVATMDADAFSTAGCAIVPLALVLADGGAAAEATSDAGVPTHGASAAALALASSVAVLTDARTAAALALAYEEATLADGRAPPQLLHWPLVRPCSHMAAPPQLLHCLLKFLSHHFLSPHQLEAQASAVPLRKLF
jgi:hypothetical protein